MQSRIGITPPTPVKTSPSLPCVPDRQSISVSTPRCAARGQPPSTQHVSASPGDELSEPAQQWIEQAQKLKDAFATQRTISVRKRGRNQGYRSLPCGLGTLQGLAVNASEAQQHARALLKLTAKLRADTVLKKVQEHAPGLSELQERMRSKAENAWKSYELALADHPMRTKALTSCVGLAVADMIAQAAGAGGSWDVLRTGRLASFGLLWHGVSAHMWYQFLDKHVMPDKSSSTKAIVTKMVLDQTLWAPVNTALFYAYLAMADGRLSSIPDILQAKLLPTILAGYALWPVAHLINFKYIPSHQRLLYINVVNLFWTVYLSGMANSTIAVDPLQGQVQKFGLAIPVSHQPAAVPPVVQSAAPPSLVQL